MKAWRGLVEEYPEFLPLPDRSALVSLNEGGTPLVEAPRLSRRVGCRVFLKLEGSNPTGSFKDRGMTYAISKAKALGSRAVVCASTGNTSASAAAYAARAGMKAFVVVPKGKIALGKLLQAMIHGARVLQLQGNFDQALEMVREVAEREGMTLVNSLNQDRIEGQTTAAFEVCEQLERAPQYHFLPVGNAGNVTAYWEGYRRFQRAGRVDSLPKMMGWQASGAAPLVLGKRVEKPDTIASAIRIGNPARWKQAEEARDQSGGLIDAVSDEEIKNAYFLLAKEEGVFCEPSSATGVAGMLKLAQAKDPRWKPAPGETAVATLTGNGLKDPDFGLKHLPGPVTVPAKIEAVLEAMNSHAP